MAKIIFKKGQNGEVIPVDKKDKNTMEIDVIGLLSQVPLDFWSINESGNLIINYANWMKDIIIQKYANIKQREQIAKDAGKDFTIGSFVIKQRLNDADFIAMQFSQNYLTNNSSLFDSVLTFFGKKTKKIEWFDVTGKSFELGKQEVDELVNKVSAYVLFMFELKKKIYTGMTKMNPVTLVAYDEVADWNTQLTSQTLI